MTASTPNENKPARALTAGRIVALVLIALAVLALGYAKTASGEDAVSVPKGAQAGDLTWKSCDYKTAEGTYTAECGTLVVPENRHDPESRLIAIPVKRIPAQSASQKPPVFGFYGGPGHSNFKFEAMARFAQDRDVVLVGYRGVDGSVSLDCPEVIDSRERSQRLGDRGLPRVRRRRVPRLRQPAHGRRHRPGRVLDPAAHRRHRARAPQARLRPDRPRQRELRHAHRSHLRLAVPAEHPPLGDGRRQSARSLPLECRDVR